jgi:hypothetical protein
VSLTISVSDINKIILIIEIINTGLFADAQKTLTVSQVPAIVKAKFRYLYPNSKVENWVLENGNYEAEVNLTDFLFDKNGKFIKAVKERPTD